MYELHVRQTLTSYLYVREEALRLCYYMRSQGYDVYAKIEGKVIHLYVANQRSYIRDKQHDMLYWKQNFATNASASVAPSAPRAARRNAMADIEQTLQYLTRRHPEQVAAANEDPLTQAEIRLHTELGRENPNSE